MVRSAELCRFASKVEPNLRGELFDFPRPRHPAHACRASSVRAGCSSPTVDKRDIPYIVVIYASSVVTTAAPIDYLVYIYPGISYCVCVLSTRRHACVLSTRRHPVRAESSSCDISRVIGRCQLCAISCNSLPGCRYSYSVRINSYYNSSMWAVLNAAIFFRILPPNVWSQEAARI